MRIALLAAIIVCMLSTPAAAQGESLSPLAKDGLKHRPSRGAAKAIRDPVSGVRIQADFAARFCNRQRSKR